MNKTICKLIGVIMLLTMMSACQLARPELQQDKAKNADRLVGVFVTFDYRAIYEAFNKLNQSETVSDTSVENSLNVINEDKKMPIGAKHVAGKDNTEISHLVLDFGDLAGYYFVNATLIDPQLDEEVSYSSHLGMNDISVSVHVNGSTHEAYKCTSNIYYDIENPPRLAILNPIYQSEDGSLYLTSDNSISTNFANETEIDNRSALTSSYKTTEERDGVTSTYESAFEVGFITKRPTGTFKLLQFDDTHQLIHQMRYSAEDYPPKIELKQAAHYLIYEPITDSAQDIANGRKLYQLGDETIDVYIPDTQGVLFVEQIELIW